MLELNNIKTVNKHYCWYIWQIPYYRIPGAKESALSEGDRCHPLGLSDIVAHVSNVYHGPFVICLGFKDKNRERNVERCDRSVPG